MAAYGCLRAINTLLESVAALGPALFPQLEANLLPLIGTLVRSKLRLQLPGEYMCFKQHAAQLFAVLPPT